MAKENKLDKLIELVNLLAKKEVALSPITPTLPINNPHVGDHDTIIKLVAMSESLEKKVDIISTKLDTKYTTTEEHAAVVEKLNDHDTRIKILEVTVTKIWSYGTALIFILGIIQFLLGQFWK